jgi:hypothetical protein
MEQHLPFLDRDSSRSISKSLVTVREIDHLLDPRVW